MIFLVDLKILFLILVVNVQETERSHLVSAILVLLLVFIVVGVVVFNWGSEAVAAVKNSFGIETDTLDEDDTGAARTLYLGMKKCMDLEQSDCLCDTGKTFTLKNDKMIRIKTEGDQISLSDYKTINNAIACYMSSAFHEEFSKEYCGKYMQLRFIASTSKYLTDYTKLIVQKEESSEIEESEINTVGVDIKLREKQEYNLPGEVGKIVLVDTKPLKLYKYYDKESKDTYLSFVKEEDLDDYRSCDDFGGCKGNYGELCKEDELCIDEDIRYSGEGECCKSCHKILDEADESEAEKKFQEAIGLYDDKKYDQAEELFKEITRDYGDSKRADDCLLYLGRIYRDQGKNEIAMEYYAHAVGDYYNYVGSEYGDVVFDAESESDALFSCSDFSQEPLPPKTIWQIFGRRLTEEEAFDRFTKCRDAKSSVLKGCTDPGHTDGECEECDSIESCDDHKQIGEIVISESPCENSLCRSVGHNACEVYEILGPTYCEESDRKKSCSDLKEEWICETEVCVDVSAEELGILGNEYGLRSLCCEWSGGVCAHK